MRVAPRLSPLNQRRWRNFKANRRAYWSLLIFSVLYIFSLGAEVIANDKPLLVKYNQEFYLPILRFYPETAFGGDFQTEAKYKDPVVQCLIIYGGSETCLEESPDQVSAMLEGKTALDGQLVKSGWILWAPIPYSYDTISGVDRMALSAPDAQHWLGTDNTARDVLARVIYGFRLSVSFALLVTVLASALGIMAGAVQGYFGGLTDLIFQRTIEIWGASPQLYIIIIVASVLKMNFWLLVGLMVLFGWTALVGLVRAEFLRARNFEYVRAARALGVPDPVIMWRHVLPNAMVATLTMLPFIITGAVGSLASLDFLGFGLPASAPSLGELTQQAKQNLQAPWLGFTAFLTFAIMLSLLIFIFEGLRDAFDPRKTFQ